MKTPININNWNRKAHFEFFKGFDEPFFGICVNVDVTTAYRHAKELQTSFFLYYLYQSLKAANQTNPFRYRIDEDGMPVEYDQVHASPTINRPDGTFGFSYMSYQPTYAKFETDAKIEMEHVQASSGLELAQADANIIHYSSIPWIQFTSISHARHYAFKESVPKISFGKMFEQDGKRLMPLSIHVHHALMDGSDVALFLERFQELLNETADA